jgi:oligopeptide transport system ATP-binding protein
VEPLLELRNLQVQFNTLDGVVHAVNGVSFSLEQGKTLGVVGESGCGKSVSVLSVMRLIQEPPGKIVDGEILYRGKDLLKFNKEEMQDIRGVSISMVFQDPMTSLNPVLTIERQITEAIKFHAGVSEADAITQAVKMLDLVGIPNAKQRLKDYPHQFSGGMRQRVMIASALALNPDILIADEPTTALDVTIQAQILELAKDIQDSMGMSMIWITHDLGVIAELADNVVVMYAGKIVEEANVFHLFENPLHPYTIALLGSLPRVDESGRARLATIPGTPPDGLKVPEGCSFAPRCAFQTERCLVEKPPLEQREHGHFVACWVDVATGREQ